MTTTITGPFDGIVTTITAALQYGRVVLTLRDDNHGRRDIPLDASDADTLGRALRAAAGYLDADLRTDET